MFEDRRTITSQDREELAARIGVDPGDILDARRESMIACCWITLTNGDEYHLPDEDREAGGA